MCAALLVLLMSQHSQVANNHGMCQRCTHVLMIHLTVLGKPADFGVAEQDAMLIALAQLSGFSPVPADSELNCR